MDIFNNIQDTLNELKQTIREMKDIINISIEKEEQKEKEKKQKKNLIIEYKKLQKDKLTMNLKMRDMKNQRETINNRINFINNTIKEKDEKELNEKTIKMLEEYLK